MPWIPQSVMESQELDRKHYRALNARLVEELAKAGGVNARLLDAVQSLERLLGVKHDDLQVDRTALVAEEGPPLPGDLGALILGVCRPGTDMHAKAVAWARGRLAAGVSANDVKEEFIRGGEM